MKLFDYSVVAIYLFVNLYLLYLCFSGAFN